MKQRFTTLMTTLILSVFLAVSASAYDVEVDGIYYSINGNNACVKRGDKEYTGDIVIPESITVNDTKFYVTSIETEAFQYCNSLTSITISNSVKSIGNWAFMCCSSLKSVTISNSVTCIGAHAFTGCISLRSVTIPTSVTSIGECAFENCSGLTSITLPNSVSSIGDYAFRGCIGITQPIFVNDIFVYLPKGYTGHYSIPENISIILRGAFENCSDLTSITIPNSVKSIGDFAFEGCSGLTSVTIPNSVTSIGNGTFVDCIGLTSVTIPNSVTSIGAYAFSGCVGLASITIPNSVISIDGAAFQSCRGLKSITIPNSVTCFGGNIFEGCDGITQTIIVNDMFIYLPKGYIGHYSIPENITKIIYGAFENCSGLVSITIPNTVTSIGDNAFKNCSGLISVTIPNSVTSIGRQAFWDCSSLTSITIPNSVTSIGDHAFSGCNSLTTVSIPNSVTSIGDYAFDNSIMTLYYDCSTNPSISISSLKELYVGDNVSIVYDYFKYSTLTKIVLGKNVTQIRTEAFTSSQLEEFTITSEEPPYLYPNVFGTQDLSKATLYVPESKAEYYQTTEPWSKFGKVLTLSGETPEEPKKCETPTISYSDGKLQFSCETEGAKCYYTLNCQDVKSGETKVEDNAVTLNACYDITCHAKAEGYVNSDIATAKLYWLTSSGTLDSSINAAKTRGVVIQSSDGFVTISGLDSSEQVDFFSSDGKALGSAKAMGGTATFAAQSGSVVVAKIGKESVKIAVK